MSFFKSLGWKRGAAAAVAAIVLGSAALGVAGAQTPGTDTGQRHQWGGPSQEQRQQFEQRYQAYFDALAKKLNVSTDTLKQYMADARKEAGFPDRSGGPGAHPQGMGPQGGPGKPGGPGAGPRGGMFFGPVLDTAAKAIGISPDQLRQELPGKTLADVARSHNVDPSKVSDALTAAMNARIDEAKQQVPKRVSDLMTHQFPTQPPGGGRR
ncbi:MAG: hypothetical protein IT307_13580 [Chloroflexi bacterium]|nr:hypothetical protein [Chloroflexota bacterium]